MKLSIIIPTICRPSLLQTLDSCRGADEVILCPDGPDALRRVRVLVEQVRFPVGNLRVIDTGGPHKDWGHTQRNLVQGRAVGDWVMHMDDDDRYNPGALDLVRAALAGAERIPHLFRAVSRTAGLVWHTRGVLAVGNITTLGIVVPNDPARMGTWQPRYGGDGDMAIETVGMYGGRAVWRDEVIAGPIAAGRGR